METMLIDTVVQNAEDNLCGKIITRACTAYYASVAKSAFEPDAEIALLYTTANRVLEEVSISRH